MQEQFEHSPQIRLHVRYTYVICKSPLHMHTSLAPLHCMKPYASACLSFNTNTISIINIHFSIKQSWLPHFYKRRRRTLYISVDIYVCLCINVHLCYFTLVLISEKLPLKNPPSGKRRQPRAYISLNYIQTCSDMHMLLSLLFFLEHK